MHSNNFGNDSWGLSGTHGQFAPHGPTFWYREFEIFAVRNAGKPKAPIFSKY